MARRRHAAFHRPRVHHASHRDRLARARGVLCCELPIGLAQLDDQQENDYDEQKNDYEQESQHDRRTSDHDERADHRDIEGEEAQVDFDDAQAEDGRQCIIRAAAALAFEESLPQTGRP